MFSTRTTSLLLSLLLLAFTAQTDATGAKVDAVRMALEALALAKSWARASTTGTSDGSVRGDAAWADCMQLYDDSELRIRRLLTGEYDTSDAGAWLSGAMTSHATCVEGLRERNASSAAAPPTEAEQREVALLLRKALAVHAMRSHRDQDMHNRRSKQNSTILDVGLLASWDTSTKSADIVVAQDGSGNYKTIKEAVSAINQWRHDGERRMVIYVKSGTYEEYIEIDRNMRNVMLVGDGMDKTVVTGKRNVPDGSTTYGSATFGVSGDNFWARDITFENTAGPEKHQAVALRVNSDHSVFYRCSFKGYQDTLFVHSQRQFYRDCHIYGTVDFIFGNAAAVLQNCNIYVRRPMGHQSNMITAQGRYDPNQNTGISIHASRVLPAQDFEAVKGSFRSYLGRPWHRYSRAVFLKTDLDGLIHPEGWARWRGGFALDTLYYGEYMNTGQGAATDKRVSWPGFHLLSDSGEAGQFTVERFIQGESWISESGVPFWSGL